MSSFRRWDPIGDAARVLDLPTTGRPSKEEIERAFRMAAKKYHPDRKHDRPDALRFRRCLESRDLLLDRFHGSGRAHLARTRTRPRPPSPRPRPHGPGMHGGDGVFAKGFPFQTLHLLTTRSKVVVKGATGVLILGMGLYDGYRRHQNKKAIAREGP
mmetsp:Transcript_10387/g.30367  ORF Transcript_10387/g.30367 Transcript_10387/m.30367 type:complete len:157 (+) Transcript_10387:274-744(+)